MKDQTFAGRCALVTGATSGIGEATARRLAAHGARVIAAGRRADRLDALAAELGPGCRALTLDVTDDDAVAALPGTLTGDWSPDILVNNAGLALGAGPADDASLDDWDRMIATNVRALVRVTRALLPALKAAPRADIVNIGSIAGTYPYPGSNAYGGTKAFVHQFSLGLRADLVGSMVRVTCVEPGMTDTEFSEVRFAGDRAKADAVYAGTTPMTGADIARVIGDVLALPPHVNVNTIELMPVCQAFGPFAVARA